MVKRLFSVTALLFILSLCTMLSGCSFEFTQVSDLIRPPVYSQDNEELRKAFKADFSSDTVYKAPISGEYLSAFLSVDLDSDEDEEALVFYADDAFDKTVSVAVYNRIDDKWKLSSQLEGDGCDVYSIEFSDFNGDSVDELVVSWSLFDSKSNKIVSVYSINKDTATLTKLSEQMYTVKEFSDVDGDGDSELFLVYLDATSGKQESTAKLLGMKDSGISVLDKRALDGSVSGYKGVYAERDDVSDTVTFLVDAYKGENQMITEVVVWNGETSSMSVPLFDSETRRTTQSWRSVKLFCTDINGDGKKEFPNQKTFENAEMWSGGEALLTLPYETNWYVIENEMPKIAQKTLVNFEEQCLFKIPDEWDGKFSVTMYTDTGKWDFYQINPYTGKKKQYLFSVVFLTEEEWLSGSESIYESYMLLDKSYKKCLAVTGINTENELNVSFDMLSTAFSYFSQ